MSIFCSLLTALKLLIDSAAVGMDRMVTTCHECDMYDLGDVDKIFEGELNPKIKFVLFERTLKITE